MTDRHRSATRRHTPARPIKRSFAINGHATSISLESAFWDALKDAAASEGVPMSELVARVDAARGEAGLSSAVRVWLLDCYRQRAADKASSG